MTRETMLMILGALVLVAPWSGLPIAWLEWMLPVLGLAVIGIAFTLRARAKNTQETLPPSPSEPSSRSSHIAFS